MKEREWDPGSRLSRVGGVFSNAIISKIIPGSKRRILEEHEGMGGLGEMRVYYRGVEVEVVRKYPLSRRKGLGYLAIRPKGEPLETAIPLSRKVVREVQLLRREER